MPLNRVAFTMRQTLLASLVIFAPVASAAGFDVDQFALDSGMVVGKAIGCKLNGQRIIKASKTALVTIDVMGKTAKERDDAAQMFKSAVELGEAYIKQKGTADCRVIDRSLDVIINLGQ